MRHIYRVRRRHIHYIWNRNMAAWLIRGNKSLPVILAGPVRAEATRHLGNYEMIVFINWQAANNSKTQIDFIQHDRILLLDIRCRGKSSWVSTDEKQHHSWLWISHTHAKYFKYANDWLRLYRWMNIRTYFHGLVHRKISNWKPAAAKSWHGW